MPEYLYSDPEDPSKVVSVFQKMCDEHVYETNGKSWNREFTPPQASENTKIDPFSKKEFAGKTATKKGTMGDVWDRSKELSEDRANKVGGRDPLLQKYFDSYSKKRNGLPPPPSMTDPMMRGRKPGLSLGINGGPPQSLT
jgi:hypothetical protein